MLRLRRLTIFERGFTLIEVLVAVEMMAVVMASAVTVVNPGEMMNKAKDMSTKAAVGDFGKVNVAYLTNQQSQAWVKNPNCLAELEQGGYLASMPNCLGELAKEGMDKSYQQKKELGEIFVNKCKESLVLCYSPKSKAEYEDAETSYTKFGVNDPGCPGKKGDGSECYWCKPVIGRNECTGPVPTPTPSSGPTSSPSPTGVASPLPSATPMDACSGDFDGTCPAGYTAGSDADCCSEAGKYWLETSWGCGCYDSTYNTNCSPGQACSLASDSCCPNWCAAGSDADCCVSSGKCWENGSCVTCPTPTPAASSEVTEITVSGRLVDEFSGNPIGFAQMLSANLDPIPGLPYVNADGTFSLTTDVTHLQYPFHQGAWAFYMPSCYYYAVSMGVVKYSSDGLTAFPDGSIRVDYDPKTAGRTFFPIIDTSVKSNLEMGDLEVRPAAAVHVYSDIEVKYRTDSPEALLGSGVGNYQTVHTLNHYIIPLDMQVRLILTDRNGNDYNSPYFTLGRDHTCGVPVTVNFNNGVFSVNQ